MSKKEILDKIKEGSGRMPAFSGILNGREEAIITFLLDTGNKKLLPKEAALLEIENNISSHKDVENDSNGNLYIARHGKGTVVKISPAGEILKEINLTGKKPSNVAFGGKDGRTVYVTLQDQKNIESFRVDTPGREWNMQKTQNRYK